MTEGIGGVVYVVGSSVGTGVRFALFPERFHSIQLWGSDGEPSEFDGQLLGQVLALVCCMRGTASEEEDDMPSAPGASDLSEEGLKGYAFPMGHVQQCQPACFDVQYSEDYPFGPISCDGDHGLFSKRRIRGSQGRDLGKDRRIHHQDDGADPTFQAALEPSFGLAPRLGTTGEHIPGSFPPIACPFDRLSHGLVRDLKATMRMQEVPHQRIRPAGSTIAVLCRIAPQQQSNHLEFGIRSSDTRVPSFRG